MLEAVGSSAETVLNYDALGLATTEQRWTTPQQSTCSRVYDAYLLALDMILLHVV